MSAQPRWEPAGSGPATPGPRRLGAVHNSEPASDTAARLTAAIALASLGAAAIHVAAAITDAEEGGLTLAFFVAVAVAQAVWGLRALAGASRTWLVLGAVGDLAVLAGWVASRPVGLPIRETAEAALPAGFSDSVASALEALIVVGAAGLALRVGSIERPAARVPALTVAAGVVLAGVATLAVLAQFGLIEALSAAS